ncbi:MAG: hypothetical protein R6X33_00710 [Candidatus Brocadiia bacterium]
MQHEINIDASQEFQRIEGFGTCLFPHRRNPEYYRREGFHRVYAEQMGLNILRINLTFFPCEPFEDPAEVDWRIIEETERARVFTEFAARLKEVNPEVRLIATVWSPPPWMKMNGRHGNGRDRNRAIYASSYQVRHGEDISENRVRPDRYEHFVAWLVAVTEFFEQKDIPLYGLSPGNEIRFSQTYNSCVWTAEDYARIIGLLGHRMEEAGYGDVLLYGPEDMTGHLYEEGTPAYVRALMGDERARRHLDRFATHGYTDGVAPDMSAVSSRGLWELIEPYGMPFWMTEGGTGPHDWPKPVTDGVGVGLHNALVAGNASAWVPWQITGAHPSTHNLTAYDGLTAKSHTVQHFTRTVPVDSRRVAAEPAFGDILVSAYLHREGGRLGIVLINPTDEDREVRLALKDLSGVEQLDLYRTTDGSGYDPAGKLVPEGGAVVLEMPARSIASLRGVATGNR